VIPVVVGSSPIDHPKISNKISKLDKKLIFHIAKFPMENAFSQRWHYLLMNDSITGKELGEKLLESVRQMKVGKGTVVHSPVTEARLKSGLSQSQFSALMGVSGC
jgi:hypothetical protein